MLRMPPKELNESFTDYAPRIFALKKWEISFTSDFDFSELPSIVVPFSGGKDSQACLELANNTTTPWAMYCDTGFDHPDTINHIKTVCTNESTPLVVLKAGNVADTCLKYGMFPRGGARHCTDDLKIKPTVLFYACLAMYCEFNFWLGVRSGESNARSKRYAHINYNEVYMPHEIMPSKYPQYLGKRGVKALLPILDWSTDEVFNNLRNPHNPLYDKGFTRVGCFPCLAGGGKDMERAFKLDDTGINHYAKMLDLSKKINKPLFESKKHAHLNASCGLCNI